ncbi:hypothetical protein [Bradyrhizobium archetypum]|uniref:Uncharacterized protein n=1 Tax=Bradyrhizobium archetypum TaxID=2721160 RepID=A0A7Y4H1N6_9BRAD|nr:hypothetical protein [Bradyrhizobium archetypum]NOJ45985.1 hypothetical protein [Bradyrhizobium archetypum]
MIDVDGDLASYDIGQLLALRGGQQAQRPNGLQHICAAPSAQRRIDGNGNLRGQRRERTRSRLGGSSNESATATAAFPLEEMQFILLPARVCTLLDTCRRNPVCCGDLVTLIRFGHYQARIPAAAPPNNGI